MSKLRFIIIISFIISNILWSVLFFSFNINFYEKYSQDKSFFKQANNVYLFLKDKSDLIEDFNQSEKSHLEDVKQIFSFTKWVFLVSTIFLIFSSLIFIYKKKYYIFFKSISNWSVLSLIFSILILLFLLYNFNYSFDIFHMIFFPQWNWSFPSNSLLINIFNQKFFFKISQSIFISSLLIPIFIIIISLFQKKIIYSKTN